MAVRQLLAVALGALLAGCLDIPAPPRPPGPLVGVEYDDASVVTGPGFAIAFATDGSHMPSGLQLTTGAGAGAELLYNEPKTDFFDRIGLAFPTFFSINADITPDTQPPTAFLAQHSAFASGPARVVIEVQWMVEQWPAGAMMPSSGNVSRFSIYPDGRIVRYDSVSPRSFGVTIEMATYTTLDAGLFERAQRERDGASEDVSATEGTETSLPSMFGSLCLQQRIQERLAVMTWRTPAESPLAAVKMSLAPPAYPDSASLVAAWVDQDDVVDSTVYTMATELVVRATADGCNSTAARIAAAFQTPAGITGATFDETTGAYVVQDAGAGSVTLTAQGDIEPGYALQTSGAVRVVRDGVELANGTDYLGQDDQTGNAVLWFPDGLSLGDQLELIAP